MPQNGASTEHAGRPPPLRGLYLATAAANPALSLSEGMSARDVFWLSRTSWYRRQGLETQIMVNSQARTRLQDRTLGSHGQQAGQGKHSAGLPEEGTG